MTKGRRDNRMEEKELTCIRCPLGCSMKVLIDGQEMQVSGNSCKKGAEYAGAEVANPCRIITTTVRVVGGEENVLPVKTEREIPKGKLFSCMRALKNVEVKAPVEIGDVILENVAQTEVRVVATKQVRAEPFKSQI